MNLEIPNHKFVNPFNEIFNYSRFLYFQVHRRLESETAGTRPAAIRPEGRKKEQVSWNLFICTSTSRACHISTKFGGK